MAAHSKENIIHEKKYIAILNSENTVYNKTNNCAVYNKTNNNIYATEKTPTSTIHAVYNT